MISSNTRNISSNELVFDQLDNSASAETLSSSIDKIQSLDKAQVKVYMGIGYFLVSSIVTILLFL